MNSKHRYQNGIPTYDDSPYVQWGGLYAQFNPYVPRSVNHPKPKSPPQGLCLLLERGKACTNRQATQMCQTVVTNKGLICSELGGVIDMRKGTTTKPCKIE